jgi:cell division septation protein DedD
MPPIGSSISEPDPMPQATPGQQLSGQADYERRRQSRIYIATILATGLLVAAGYVGTRIFAAKPHQPAPSRITISNRATPAVPPALPEKAQAEEAPADLSATPAAQGPAAASVQAEAAEAPIPDSPQNTPAADAGFATPRPGEQYLQVAALSTPMVYRYVSELRKSKLEPVVAPGPWPGIARVLVGPFEDRESLESARALLQKLGASPFVRSY